MRLFEYIDKIEQLSSCEIARTYNAPADFVFCAQLARDLFDSIFVHGDEQRAAFVVAECVANDSLCFGTMLLEIDSSLAGATREFDGYAFNFNGVLACLVGADF